MQNPTDAQVKGVGGVLKPLVPSVAFLHNAHEPGADRAGDGRDAHAGSLNQGLAGH